MCGEGKLRVMTLVSENVTDGLFYVWKNAFRLCFLVR